MQVAISPEGLENVLAEELGSSVVERHGRLFLFDAAAKPVWAQNIWLRPKTFKFKSISEAARHLRSIQRNWWLHSTESHRRAVLIKEELEPLKAKPIAFPSTMPKAPLGAFTLLDANTLLYSEACSSPYPDGEVHFLENKIEPPSRAYLKLWEWFTLEGIRPAADARAIDLGSSPGGWTWALDQLNCKVISVDKAPLAADKNFSSRVGFLQKSAFDIDPLSMEPVDWLFSDIICYPERLLALVEKWLASASPPKNFVCTIKFQAATDHAVVKEFQKIEGSKLRHLTANKHELTWSLCRE